jgi:WD40 repeat protein
MSELSAPIYQYSVGGSLRVEDRTYVTRQADRDFYEGLKADEFCYVLNSRQMGKSSLGVRMMARLKSEGIACAFIDITSIVDGNITENQWYAGLIRRLVESFGIDRGFDLRTWLNDRDFLSSIQRFSEFIETVVLIEPNRKFVIFVDEIDSILRLGNPADDFFAYIRSCWNERATKPEYDRLTFAILGVAEPSDLIQERQRTPFNIGRAIELTGFSFEEAQPLVIGLATKAENPQAVLHEILAWTGGQPFLTQKVCQSIAQLEITIRAGAEIEIVGHTIRTQIIDNWEMHDKPEHLATIRNRIFESKEKHIGQLLRIYQQILVNGEIVPDNSRRQMELRLTGLVVKFDNKLKVYNQIYREVFDRDWLDKALLDLRPYAESLNAWVASGYQDESRLLQGSALQQALMWSEERNLGAEDYRFLNASQAAALANEQQANQILAVAKKAAESALTEAEAQLGSLQEQEEKAKQRLVKTQGRVKLRENLLGILVVTIVGSFFLLKIANDNFKLAAMKLATVSSKAALNNNQGFEAMVQGVKAVKKLQELDKLVGTSDERFQAFQAFKQANYPVLGLKRLQGHSDIVTSANFSRDGSKIVTASWDKTARVWDLQGKLLATISGHLDRVYSANFSPDGRKIVTASWDKTARVWDLQGKLLATISGHSDTVYSANFSHDGSKIVTASWDKTARVWDLQGKLLATISGHSDSVWSANFSPDGSKIVTVSGDKTAQLWDLQGKLLATISGHSDRVYSANFSPNGSEIVTASADKTARVWDLQGNLLATISGHSDRVYSANFSPDGSKIVTASADNTALVWDLQGNLLATISGHSDRVYSANFSPDDSKIVTASRDKTARVWILNHNLDIDSLDTDLDRLLTLSCNRLHDYLATNPNVKPEDRELCGIELRR